MQMDTKTITVNNLPTSYYEAGAGNGRAVLLLHGIPGGAPPWGELLALMSDEFRLIAPDLPGFGSTARLPQNSYEAYFQWINGLANALNIEQFVIVGHDFGALLARLYAAAEPKRVPACVLISGGKLPGTAPALRFLMQLPVIGGIYFSSLTSQQTTPAALEALVAAEHRERLIDEAFSQQIRQALPATTRALRLLALAKLPQERTPPLPVLLLWGTEDRVTPLEEGKYLHSRMPTGQWAEIAGCGHMPHLEAADVTAFQMGQFLTHMGRPVKRGPGVAPLRGG